MKLPCPLCETLQGPNPDCTRCNGLGEVEACSTCNADGTYFDVDPDCEKCSGKGDVPV